MDASKCDRVEAVGFGISFNCHPFSRYPERPGGWLLFLRCLQQLSSEVEMKAGRIIPSVIDQNPCAHVRLPIDMIFHGRS